MKDVFEQMKARLEVLLSNKYWEKDEDFDFNALQDEINEMEYTVQEYEGYPFHGNEESLYNKVKKLISRVKEEAEFMDDDDMLDMMFPNGLDDEEEIFQELFLDIKIFMKLQELTNKESFEKFCAENFPEKAIKWHTDYCFVQAGTNWGT